MNDAHKGCETIYSGMNETNWFGVAELISAAYFSRVWQKFTVNCAWVELKRHPSLRMEEVGKARRHYSQGR